MRYSRPSSPPRISRHDLGGELELQAAVVDRPRAVGLQVQPVVGVGDEVGERAGVAGLERDVGHAHDRLAGEAVGARAAAGGAEADGGGGLAVGQRGAQHAALDEVGAHGGDALVVPAERAQAAGQRRVGGDVQRARSRSAASRGRRAPTQLVPA